MMSGPHPLRGLELLYRSDALAHIKAAVSSARFNKTLLSNLEQLSGEHVLLRWSLILIAGGYSKDEADVLLRQWTFSNEHRSRITGVLQADS